MTLRGGTFSRPDIPFEVEDGRRIFLRRAAELQPDLLDTLLADVYPVARHGYCDRDKGPWLKAVAVWQERWNLTDRWVRDTVYELLCFLSICESERRHPGKDPSETLRGLWPVVCGDERFRASMGDYTGGDRSFDAAVRRTREAARKEAEEAESNTAGRLFAPWNPLAQTAGEFASERQAIFKRALDRYVAAVEGHAAEQGMLPASRKTGGTRKDPLRHFEWLVRFQVQQWSYAEIAKHYHAADKTVKTAIPKTADLIGLTRRTVATADPTE